MIEVVIKKNEAGQRFDKFLKKYLSEAPNSFIYKMLRKKNITLNGSKSDGSDMVKENDVVKLFLSDETIEKFRKEIVATPRKQPAKTAATKTPLSIIYEDEDILLANKPVGMLSQKASDKDVSMNEVILEYLLQKNALTQEELRTFRPSVCNRLDRNTSGMITFGKSLAGLQMLSQGLKDRTIDKYYLCVVSGRVSERSVINAFLTKDEKSNKVQITKDAISDASEKIMTEYIPVCTNKRFTLLKIKLHTGKTHQIRAHLAAIGHPLVGDFKYGIRVLNQEMDQKYHINYQILHAFEMYFPDRKQRFFAPIPSKMMDFLKKEGLWEPGSQEALEALH